MTPIPEDAATRSAGDAPPVVYLQVGAAFGVLGEIQQTLWAHRATLREAGLLYGRDYPLEDVHASASLRRDEAALQAMPRAAGAWERVAERARNWRGPSVISHGSLGLAAERDVQEAVRSLHPAEVHVVLTLTDLTSQTYAHWHQLLTSGADRPFADFVDDLARGVPTDDTASFHSMQDPVGILARWSSAVPADRIHVIVAAPSGSRYASPWPQFCHLVGIDTDVVPAAEASPVSWLDHDDAEILRRVNGVLAGRLHGAPYDRAVKNLFAGSVLSRTPRTMRIPHVSRDAQDWLAAWETETIASLADAGYHVIGELADLRATPHWGEPASDDPNPEHLLARTLEAGARVLTRMRDTRNRVERAEQALAEQKAAISPDA